MCIASGASSVISCGVQPASNIIRRRMMPPSGSVTTLVMPFTLVTGMTLLCGFTATSARIQLMSPSSAVSTVPGTALISSVRHAKGVDRPG
jgi:hypothetical protein